MADLLVETKLLVPRPRRQVVPRPRLINAVRRAPRASLTLVSAPAGFGKTTLVTALVAGRAGSEAGQPSIAWVSLDERDRDATRFWSYVLQALEHASPGSTTSALTLLDSEIPLDAVLASMINELSVRPGELILVLDDYHVVDGPEVSEGVAFLLDHLPPQFRLIISTRADPSLPLARLRARGELVEVRASQLRFTGDEATAYLNEVHRLDLTAADVAALAARTEGWIAALQLAALSLRDRDDPTAFIAGFAGDDRFVVDYLADEVLDQQPPAVRRFLLDTSIIDRLTGPLCDAITGDSGGGAVLESLERRNLLIVPLDDRRRWYRYHHLFADLLQARLIDERPGDVAALHRRAGDWYQQAGDMEAAVRHAFAAGEQERAADLIELAGPELRRQRGEQVIRRWIVDVPPAVVRQRPVLASGFIAALMACNEFDGIERRLNDLEKVLSGPREGLVVRDDAAWTRLPALIATHRAGLALVSGDLAGTVEHADRALADAASDDLLTTAAASALKGLASWARGDLDGAHRAYTTAADELSAAGHVADVLGCTVTLVDLEITQGRLGDAHRTVTRALRLGETAAAGGPTRGTADMWVALSRVTWERGDLAATAEYLHRAADLGESAGLPQHPYRWRVALAQLRAAEGDMTAADALLEEAEQLYSGDFSPNVRPVAATRARVQARAGNLAAARKWARTREHSAGDEVAYLYEYEHVTLARVLLAEHAMTEDPRPLLSSTALLQRLREAAETGGRIGSLLEILILQGIASERGGQRDHALRCLEQAARLAEPEGWTRVFLDHGPSLTRLLGALGQRHREWAFLRDLHAATRAGPGTTATARPRTASIGQPSAPSATTHQLVEPLSTRELEVLRLLASDLDGPAIARQLSVSLTTVRTHTQHIYAKLGVNNRRAAVRRGHQLNL